jgi:hypothetical protein
VERGAAAATAVLASGSCVDDMMQSCKRQRSRDQHELLRALLIMLMLDQYCSDRARHSTEGSHESTSIPDFTALATITLAML